MRRVCLVGIDTVMTLGDESSSGEAIFGEKKRHSEIAECRLLNLSEAKLRIDHSKLSSRISGGAG